MLPVKPNFSGVCELVFLGCCISMKSEFNSSFISESGGHVRCIMESNAVQGSFIQQQVTVHTREPSDTFEDKISCLTCSQNKSLVPCMSYFKIARCTVKVFFNALLVLQF